MGYTSMILMSIIYKTIYHPLQAIIFYAKEPHVSITLDVRGTLIICTGL
jgi:hypothetical protein